MANKSNDKNPRSEQNDANETTTTSVKGPMEMTKEEMESANFDDQQKLAQKIRQEDMGEGQPSEAGNNNLNEEAQSSEPELSAEQQRAKSIRDSQLENPNDFPASEGPEGALTAANDYAGVTAGKVRATYSGVDKDGVTGGVQGDLLDVYGDADTGDIDSSAGPHISTFIAPMPPIEYGYDMPENDNIDPIETDHVNDLKDRNRREGGIIDPLLNGNARRPARVIL